MSSVSRRQFLTGAGALLVTPFVASARQRARRQTVGSLNEWNYSEAWEPYHRRIVQRFKSLGWTEGRNFAFRPVYADYDVKRLEEFARQFVAERVDAIWVTTTACAVAAVHATKSIPIVLAGASAYPVECGLIKSFPRPGGNVTGVAFFNGIQVQSKIVEFVREILPSAKRLAWIALPPDLVTVSGGYFRPEGYYEKIARSHGFELGYYECRTLEDFEPAFAAIRAWNAEALMIEPGALSAGAAPAITQLAAQAGIASFFNSPFNVARGGLLSYGPIYEQVLDDSVTYVDRILRGSRPSALPVEMPNELELVVNTKTAKALGLSIPNSIMLRVDRVIE